ncbi:MAG: Gfo/Idh/MocA family protein [Verrucomicrobiales bacterium]
MKPELPLPTHRRHFIKSVGGTAAMLSASMAPNLLLGQAKGANERVRVGVMGLGRGRGHISALMDVPNAELAYVCDVDKVRLAAGAKAVVDKGGKQPKAVEDFRRMLDDGDLDAISIATPNFCHTPAAIAACRAGKHVYVEKPGSYNAYEARKVVEVAKTTDRKVQMGTQRRSYPGCIAGIQKLREGAIGRVLHARCWYANKRQTIGKGQPAAPPEGLNWALWQGPTQDRPFKDNLVHYNWHWHWYYGGGELANNGIHSLDIARWALGVQYPERVTCEGGRYHFEDDQETPDTCEAAYSFGKSGLITWSGTSCHQRKPEKVSFVTVYGEGGEMDFNGSGYTTYDLDGKEIDKNTEKPSDVPHFQNWVNAITSGEPLNQPIAQGQISTLLCHLGNIAYRTTGAVKVDPQTGDLVENAAGMKLWAREEGYRTGWDV